MGKLSFYYVVPKKLSKCYMEPLKEQNTSIVKSSTEKLEINIITFHAIIYG